jgi:hypothetical protein
MPSWNEMEAKRYHQRRQAALEQLERDREVEADRLASLANPPKYDGSRCHVPFPSDQGMDLVSGLEVPKCPLGISGCILNHDASDPIPKEAREANNRAWDEQRKRDSHFMGD